MDPVDRSSQRKFSTNELRFRTRDLALARHTQSFVRYSRSPHSEVPPFAVPLSMLVLG